jgi:hypothetical protein
VVLGGRQFYLPPDLPDQPRNVCGFLRADPGLAPLGPQGYPDVVALVKVHAVSDIPVWDAKETLLVGPRYQNPVFCTGLSSFLAEGIAAHPFAPATAAKHYWNDGVENAIDSGLPADRRRSALPEVMKSRQVYSPLLAGNAVVFLSGYQKDWSLFAVSRTDTALLWSVKLPGQPVFGGLSLTSAGDVLAPLIDGRVACIGATEP